MGKLEEYLITMSKKKFGENLDMNEENINRIISSANEQDLNKLKEMLYGELGNKLDRTKGDERKYYYQTRKNNI